MSENTIGNIPFVSAVDPVLRIAQLERELQAAEQRLATVEAILRKIDKTGFLYKNNMDLDAEVANYLSALQNAAGQEKI